MKYQSIYIIPTNTVLQFRKKIYESFQILPFIFEIIV